MAIASLTEILDAVDDIDERFTAASDAMTALLQGGQAVTSRQVQGLRAAISGLLEDVKAARASLDEVDAIDYLLVDDGARIIALWAWQRGTRRVLVQLAGHLLALTDLAARFDGSATRKVVIAKDGDTLQTIAARELGDWRAWPGLLQANPGVAVGVLSPGTTLVLP